MMEIIEENSDNRIHRRRNRIRIQQRSKSLDDLVIHRLHQRRKLEQSNSVSNTTRTLFDLSLVGCDGQEQSIGFDDEYCENENRFDNQPNQVLVRSRSAPVSPTHVYDEEFAAFIQCEQQHQQVMTNSFVYNMDLSGSLETSHQTQSRTAIFDDDDFLPESTTYAPAPAHIIHSNLLNACLTITEENEEELEQLRRDDDEERKREQEQHMKSHHYLKIHDESDLTAPLHDDDDRADILENDTDLATNCAMDSTWNQLDKDSNNDNERLSTIYESPIATPIIEEDEEEEEDLYDDAYDKLVVYDIAKAPSIEKNSMLSPKTTSTSVPSFRIPSSPSYSSPVFDRTRIRSCYTEATLALSPSFSNQFSASNLCGTTNMISSKVFHPPSSESTHRTSSSSTSDEKSSSSPVINVRNFSTNPSLTSLPIQPSSPTRSAQMSLSVPMLLLSTVNDTHLSKTKKDQLKNAEKQLEHMQKPKLKQTSSSSLSDFIIPNGTSSTFKTNSIDYEEVPSVHHSLTDCSLMQQISCCTRIHGDDEETADQRKLSNSTARRPSFSRRILTNGLLLSYCTGNSHNQRSTQSTTPSILPQIHRSPTKRKSEENPPTLSSPTSSSSSQSSSPTGEKLMSRSDYHLQDQDPAVSQNRKSTSLKNVRGTTNESSSKILYPIDFETHHEDPLWCQKLSSNENKVPTSDSGIVIDSAGTRPTSKSSIDDNDGDVIPTDTTTNSTILKQYEYNYRQTLADLTLIKKNIVDIESRLTEAMRELEIERALVEGEHELVFKQILDASEEDQEKLRHLYDDLQLLIDRIMNEKTSIRREIDYTQDILFKLEDELHELEQEYRPSDDKILKKKELINETRKRQEDLEFQLMELETRYEAELEQAEFTFQNERLCANQNAKIRQNTLRDLDHQQKVILQQAALEKEKLEREKQKLKFLFKQKKMEANELEQKLNELASSHEKNVQKLHISSNGYHSSSVIRKENWSNGQDVAMYHSTPANLYNSLNCTDSLPAKVPKKDNHQEKLNEIREMITVAKLEKMAILEEQLREKYNDLMNCHKDQKKHIEVQDKVTDEVQNRDIPVQRQVKLREKNRLQERPLTRYLPIRSIDFDLRSHIEGAGHLVDSPHVHLTSTSCRGFLHKMGGIKFKTWNRRWFVFDRKRRSLFYYQDKSETKLRGCIYFQSIVEVYVDHVQSMSLRSPEPREATFIVKTFERPFYLVAPTVESMRIWVDVLITGAEGNSFAGES